MSKLADLMFGLELHNRLTTVDSPITSICAHPGYSITNIKNGTPLYIRFLDALPQPFLAQSAAQGALPTLFAAAVPGRHSDQQLNRNCRNNSPMPVRSGEID